MKKCNVCLVYMPLDNFRKRKDSKDGYRNDCKSCCSIKEKKKRIDFPEKFREKEKKYYENNKELVLSKNKIWRDNNKEYISNYHKEYRSINKNYFALYRKQYYEDNKENISLYSKEYRDKNKDKLKFYHKEYMKSRLDNDYIFRLKNNLRSLLKNYLKDKDRYKTNNILGCSYEYFILYLESKFEPWMTWENRGLYNGEFNYGWDIDHIIPISFADTEEDIIILNHYTNLQPLCSKVNRDIKKDKLYYEN